MITDRNRILNEICIQDAEVVVDDESKYRSVFEKVVLYSTGMKLSETFWTEKRKASPIMTDKQLFYSKLNEFFDRKFAITQLGFPMCEVDVAIREGSKKGWFVDLPFSNIDGSFPDVHCKSCNEDTLSIVGDYSWSFQLKNDKNGYGRDPLLDRPESMDLVFFSYMDKSYRKATVKVTAPWKLVFHLLEKPVLEKLSDIKRCIYYRDLVKATGGTYERTE